MRHLKTIMSVLLLLSAFACAKVHEEELETGTVSFTVSNNPQIADMTRSSVADFTSLPSGDDFDIAILDASSASVWSGKASEMDAAIQLLEGYYTVKASYGDETVEGFDKPYFVGEETFTVRGGENIEVPVPVELGNSIVKISCSQNFVNYFKEAVFTVKRQNDIASFRYGNGGNDFNAAYETRGLFVESYKFKVSAVLKTENGEYDFEKEYDGIDAATAYAVNFDITNVGGTAITVTFKDTVETVELEDIELN